MSRRLVKRFVAALCVAGIVIGPLFAATAAAQGTLSEDDQDIVDEFLAEATLLLALDGGIPDLIGEPGVDDLPPGVMIFLGEQNIDVEPEFPMGEGSTLTGPCQGIAASFEPDGDTFQLLDMAADFDDAAPPIDLFEPVQGDGNYAQAFTADNPFEVHVDGFVIYAGRHDPPPIDHQWYIETLGLSLDSGGDPNNGAENRNRGTVNLKDDLPAGAKVSALFRINGAMVSDGGSCTGDGFFRTVGGPPLLQGAGAVLVLAFGFGALFNARPAQTFHG